MRIRLTAVLASALVLGFAASIHGQATKPAATPTHTATASSHIMLAASDMKWGPAPDALPSGAQLAVLEGDPSKAGARFVIAAKFADGYTIPPHWHPTDEAVTILSGTLQMEMGKTVNAAAFKDLGAGSFALMPAKQPHMARAKGETVVQISAMGPFEITYVNPKDDPRTTKKMTSNTRR
jgi:quercetin dioxygenase-like cupin family protein